MDTVTVTSEDDAPARLGLALHLQGRAEPPPAFAPDSDFASNPPGPVFAYWKDPQSATYQNTATVPVRFGELRLNGRFEVPGEFRLTHARTPDVPPARRASFYLETHGTKATFTTTLEPATPAGPANQPPGQ